MNNLRQVGLATLNRHDTFKKLPPMFGKFGGANDSVFYHILPGLDEVEVYEALRPAGDPPEKPANTFAVKTFMCPSDSNSTKPPHSSYAANMNVFWASDGTRPIVLPDGIRRGTSNTIMYAEKLSLCGSGGNRWDFDYRKDTMGVTFTPAVGFARYGPETPGDPPTPASYVADYAVQISPRSCDPKGASSNHPEVINVCMCDGSVRPVTLEAANSGYSPGPPKVPSNWEKCLDVNCTKEVTSDW